MLIDPPVQASTAPVVTDVGGSVASAVHRMRFGLVSVPGAALVTSDDDVSEWSLRSQITSPAAATPRAPLSVAFASAQVVPLFALLPVEERT
jgi:hypothetical protein